MSRRFPCVRAGLLGLALLVAVPAPAADDPDVRTWRITTPVLAIERIG